MTASSLGTSSGLHLQTAVSRVEVARWRLGWARRGGDTQTISYTATLTEYR